MSSPALECASVAERNSRERALNLAIIESAKRDVADYLDHTAGPEQAYAAASALVWLCGRESDPGYRFSRSRVVAGLGITPELFTARTWFEFSASERARLLGLLDLAQARLDSSVRA